MNPLTLKNNIIYFYTERKGKGKRNMICEKETLIGCLPHAPPLHQGLSMQMRHVP